MAIQDLRSDLRGEIALTQQIGSGFGAFFGARAGQRNKALLEQVETDKKSALVGTLARGSAEGWKPAQLHAEILKIPGIVQNEAYQKYVLGRKLRGSDEGPLDRLKFWQQSEKDAELAGNEPMLQEARRQQNLIMKQINPDFGKPQATVGSDKLAGEIQHGINEALTLTRPLPSKNKVRGEKEIEQLIAKPQETDQKSPYEEYSDAFLENGVWKVIRDGKRYRIED